MVRRELLRHLRVLGLARRVKSSQPSPSLRVEAAAPDWTLLTRPLGQPSPATHPHLMSHDQATPGISRDELATRRQVLVDVMVGQLKEAGVAPAPLLFLLRAPSASFSAPDVPNPFRQNSDFLYLSGCREPGAVLAVFTDADKPAAARTALFVGERDAHKELWEGPRAGPDGAAALTGIADAQPLGSLPAFLNGLLRQTGPTRLLSYDKWDFGDLAPILEKAAEAGKAANTEVKPKDITHQMRWSKSEAEMELMRIAGSIGSASLSEAVALSRSTPSLPEGCLGSAMELSCRGRGALGLSYPPVIAGGNRANTIHYIANDVPLSDGDVVLMDAGADYHGYVSDITRSWVVGSGPGSDAARSLHQALEEVHKELLAYAAEHRPLTLANLYFQMLGGIGESLQRLGVFPKGDGHSQLRRRADAACPHHVSHWLGMDVHDVASIPRSISVAPNVPFTIEPGVYFPETCAEVPPEFRGLGMRVEDDVALTDTGFTVFSAGIPTSLDALHALGGKGK